MDQAIQECSATDKRAPTVTNVMAIVVAGMTKVFVGEITAEGEWKEKEQGVMRVEVCSALTSCAVLLANSTENHGKEWRDGTHSSTSSS